MLTPQHKKIQIPIQLVEYVIKNDLHKPFQIYLYLSTHSNGLINTDDLDFSQMSDAIGRQKRTLKLHLKKLLALNWVGYNAVSGNYWIRSLRKIRLMHEFKKRQAATFYLEYVKDTRAFLAAVLISTKVRGAKYYHEVVKTGRLKSAATSRDAALQGLSSRAASPTPSHYGMSLKSMAQLLCCSQTTACELKQLAVKAGFLKVNHKFEVFQVLPKPDYSLRTKLYKAYPELKGKIRFKTVRLMNSTKKNPKFGINVLIQSYDEIIPKIKFKNISKFSRLQRAA